MEVGDDISVTSLDSSGSSEAVAMLSTSFRKEAGADFVIMSLYNDGRAEENSGTCE